MSQDQRRTARERANREPKRYPSGDDRHESPGRPGESRPGAERVTSMRHVQWRRDQENDLYERQSS